MGSYGYARVRTRKKAEMGNSFEEQVKQLEVEGCEVIIQEQYTGSKLDRPKFEDLMNRLEAGDKLVVTKLDRFARNITEVIEELEIYLPRSKGACVKCGIA